ncbi:MAG TPA: TIGR03435 family protein [Bryobacteraceae bacterium]|nr:TIGR03435 family protein [Bryobacteraceae bacterium]
MRRLSGILLLVGSAAAHPPAPRPQFDVASIKLNKSPDARGRLDSKGGRIIALNIPPAGMLLQAFGIKSFQLVGTPTWMTLDRYDIEATADGNPPAETMRLMLQALFEDRFQLKYHRETKEMPVFALVVSKPGKLHEAEGDCKPPQRPKPDDPPAVRCGSAIISVGRIVGRSVTAASFADIVSRVTDRLVLDKTNLTGKYDINLEFTRDRARVLPAGDAAPTGIQSPQAPDPGGPTIFTALQEQLGLKLDSQKAPVDVIIIDHIERPSEN